MHCIKLDLTQKINGNSNDSNNVHFSGVRLTCSPYLAITSATDLLEPMMTKCGVEIESWALKMNIFAIFAVTDSKLFKSSFYQLDGEALSIPGGFVLEVYLTVNPLISAALY